MSAGGLDNKTGTGAEAGLEKVEKVKKVEKVEKVEKVGPRREIFKILVGNWVAQWDSLYRAWFYYNAKTDHSTWDKPKELVHLSLNPPKGI